MAMQYLTGISAGPSGGNPDDELDIMSRMVTSGTTGRQAIGKAFQLISRRIMNSTDIDSQENGTEPSSNQSISADREKHPHRSPDQDNAASLNEVASTENLSGSWVLTGVSSLDVPSLSVPPSTGLDILSCPSHESLARTRSNTANSNNVTDTLSENPKSINNSNSETKNSNNEIFEIASFDSFDADSSDNYSVLNDGMPIENSFILLGNASTVINEKVDTLSKQPPGLCLDWQHRNTLQLPHNNEYSQYPDQPKLGDRVYNQRTIQIKYDFSRQAEKKPFDTALAVSHNRPIGDFKLKFGGRFKTARAKLKYSKFSKL
ncbi:hypothetical protein NADFUDRAFT_83076 [Nadsonia fulvescens var. elongata DSM 6958]|uniref:Uncharacterized protein n=1 Tax=Nadsonia fulvescens var. elongata DSM 6958 TaxID=857566 RepID=A0A1E3PHQ0_9ASCO|nr:hypothetical protein NADFUDRAFT_83076 [Nadsonia fulvescens var. elongata DSM 6958]